MAADVCTNAPWYVPTTSRNCATYVESASDEYYRALLGCRRHNFGAAARIGIRRDGRTAARRPESGRVRRVAYQSVHATDANLSPEGRHLAIPRGQDRWNVCAVLPLTPLTRVRTRGGCTTSCRERRVRTMLKRNWLTPAEPTLGAIAVRKIVRRFFRACIDGDGPRHVQDHSNTATNPRMPKSASRVDRLRSEPLIKWRRANVPTSTKRAGRRSARTGAAKPSPIWRLR